MDFTSSQYVRVTAALIVDKGRLFIAQRPSYKKFGLMWEFPGGKVEPGESLEESLVREIREELSWEICVHGLFKTITHESSELCIELYAFWCAIHGGALHLNEHAACSWAYPVELRTIGLTLPDLKLLSFIEELGPLPAEIIPQTGMHTSAQ
jgi:mutator protein MutT